MFDFDPQNPKHRRQAFGAARGRARAASCQKLMPFWDIQGPFLRCSDGGTCVYLTYPGRNLSLMTDEQKQDYALATGRVLSAITAETSAIWLLPEQVSAESNLALCDQAIERFSHRAFRDEGTDGDRKCLELLERHVRQDFARDAVASNNVAWKAYLGMKFYRASDEDVLISSKNIIRLIAEHVKKDSRMLESRHEILDFIDLYFKGWVPVERFLGPKVVLPKIV